MSSIRALSGIRRLSILTAIAALLVTALPGIGAGQTPGFGDSPQAARNSANSAGPSKVSTQNQSSNIALQTLWSDYIWHSIPVRALGSLTPSPLSRAYQANSWQPVFINSRFGLNSKAKSLLVSLRTLDKDAIDPDPFELHRLSEVLENLKRCRSALCAVYPQYDAATAQSFLDLQRSTAPAADASHSNEASMSGTTNLEVVAKDYRRCFQAASEADIRLTTDFFLFTKDMDPFSPVADGVKVLLGNEPISKYFAQLQPKGFGYQVLLSAYKKYQELATRGGQIFVYFPSPVHPGASGKDIRLLQERLGQEGFYSGRITGVYNRATQRAVRRFQTANMLTPDAVIGRWTQARLNLPFDQKAAMIAFSLRAIRNSPSRRYKRFILVNIPQFMLGYYKNGKLAKAEKAIVGMARGKKVFRQGRLVGENQTPTMVSQIYQIIFNPRWYVDGRIRRELNAVAKSNPDWFQEHGYVKMESKYRFGEHRIFQKSGPKNALGRVKFDFPNPYVVYLHDTNQRYLFARSRRDFSHGCIRVDNALTLARILLQDDRNPYVNQIHTILEGTRTTFIKLSKPVPICVDYIPVVVRDKGQILFAGDPYGLVSEPSQIAQKRPIRKRS